ncbi:MAG: recombination-associated protein RdgC [Comamonadaceae bacterium]|uniref:recombination-associated protein RdgC n=1 Tax=Candidatus Skiveiella danica TaxID=3386177 RepID=UPI0009CBDE28|nr:recombination-associated protein RdgC [Comamonadaceae bacterium]MBK9988634.1 recombination-associated protein RdgC [Betaproteobacteria bacterium]OQC17737.1 MAG: Recombination-associated protein RdgC [Alphaproteobacteria bacterium ADurb.Bin100]
MFKNLIVYRIGPDWSATVEHMEEALAPARFVECGATQQKSIGWIEPRGEKHGALVESIGGQRILKLQIETKAVPGSVVKRKAQEQIEHIEATTGRKPGKREIKDIRDDALLALLPMAFTKQSSVQVWIDLASRLLMTDAGSQAKADEVITALVSALPGLPLTLLQTMVSPQVAMTQWLTAASPEEWPLRLSVERECELKSNDEEKSVVKFTRHNLLNDEIRHHVAQGKLPVTLALSWDGRVAFVLTEALQLKKISFLEGVFEGTSAGKEDGFDADVAIATGELGKLIPDLIDALGGEMPQTAAASSAPPTA